MNPMFLLTADSDPGNPSDNNIGGLPNPRLPYTTEVSVVVLEQKSPPHNIDIGADGPELLLTPFLKQKDNTNSKRLASCSP